MFVRPVSLVCRLTMGGYVLTQLDRIAEAQFKQSSLDDVVDRLERLEAEEASAW